MEFTNKQMLALNALLPQFYRMETRDTRKARRPEPIEAAQPVPQERQLPVINPDPESNHLSEEPKGEKPKEENLEPE